MAYDYHTSSSASGISMISNGHPWDIQYACNSTSDYTLGAFASSHSLSLCLDGINQGDNLCQSPPAPRLSLIINTSSLELSVQSGDQAMYRVQGRCFDIMRTSVVCWERLLALSSPSLSICAFASTTPTVTVGEVTGSQVFWLDSVVHTATRALMTIPTYTTPTKTGPKAPLIIGIVVTGVVFLLMIECIRRYRRNSIVPTLYVPPSLPLPPPQPLPSPPAPPYMADYEGQRMRMEMENMRRESEMLQIQAQQARHEENEAQRLRLENARLETEMIRLRSQPAPILFTPPSRQEGDEAQRLRVEMENLRRENEAIRLRAQQAPSVAPLHGREVDAGPADAPPAYNYDNYTP
ncbi:hypothetical protein FPV67DRAFT_1448623 [Lyophyllum atratum]|nr:hypothetical protein FPV67DRAFT_1448623 [Lyophyllum atratum]